MELNGYPVYWTVHNLLPCFSHAAAAYTTLSPTDELKRGVVEQGCVDYLLGPLEADHEQKANDILVTLLSEGEGTVLSSGDTIWPYCILHGFPSKLSSRVHAPYATAHPVSSKSEF